ncbi:MAG: hypothetical protein C4522_16085 [Desulfobacteraceae bacterium]|nr:MAG: hypothetical protein C4522_16085 [Desulfobacteraceae bacterium]
MKLKYWIPFLFFIIPTPVITYFMWASHIWAPYPREEMISIIGLCVMWFFTGVTYLNGIRAVMKDRKA